MCFLFLIRKNIFCYLIQDLMISNPKNISFYYENPFFSEVGSSGSPAMQANPLISLLAFFWLVNK
jgi:hypothetical protein